MKKPNPIKKALASIAFLSIWVLVFPFAALPSGANQDEGDAKIDYAATRQDISRFELVINDIISNAFGSDSFAVVQRPKGAYLPGYGISFSFLINIHRAVINTPFGQVSRAGINSTAKMRRIEDLKDRLIRALQDNSENFRQLRKEDNVTIVAFFEDRNIPDEPNANRTIVLSAFKKDLDELGHKNDRIKEFKQRMKIVEY
jgi:hypothetical protein